PPDISLAGSRSGEGSRSRRSPRHALRASLLRGCRAASVRRMGALRRLLGHRDRERPSDRPPSPELLPPELDELDLAIVSAAQPYTMTSRERLFALVKAVRYVVSAGVPGDIVECGVWRGGSMVAAARTLLRSDERSRHLYLFDTFEGMPPPSDDDVELSGESAAAILVRSSKDEHVWAVAPRTEVEAVMATTGYDPAPVHAAAGR